MDLTEEQADILFGDDRGRDISDITLSHWIYIQNEDDGIVIEAENTEYRLTDDQVERMKRDLEWDSIWRAISERTKCLQYVQQIDSYYE